MQDTFHIWITLYITNCFSILEVVEISVKNVSCFNFSNEQELRQKA